MKKVQFIGEGDYTKAYKLGNKVLLKSKCPAKEAMALKMFPTSNLFPKVRMYDKMGDDTYDYIMNYYPDMNNRGILKNLNPYYKKFYRELEKMSHDFWSSGLYYKGHHHKLFTDCVNRMKGIRKYHKDALIQAFFAVMNVIDDHKIGFEIPPRNIATTKGRLILIDCFFEK